LRVGSVLGQPVSGRLLGQAGLDVGVEALDDLVKGNFVIVHRPALVLLHAAAAVAAAAFVDAAAVADAIAAAPPAAEIAAGVF